MNDAQTERAEIAKFIGWFGRRLNLRGGSRAITTHDLSIMVARGDRAPADAEYVDARWLVRPEADVIVLRAQLKTAVMHLEHMAAWISRQNLAGLRANPDYHEGYSFESLSEDMPGIKAALE